MKPSFNWVGLTFMEKARLGTTLKRSRGYEKRQTRDMVRRSTTSPSCRPQGRAVKKDDAEAFKWFHAAADQGIPQSQDTLGTMFLDGVGTKKDPKEAAEVV